MMRDGEYASPAGMSRAGPAPQAVAPGLPLRTIPHDLQLRPHRRPVHGDDGARVRSRRSGKMEDAGGTDVWSRSSASMAPRCAATRGLIPLGHPDGVADDLGAVGLLDVGAVVVVVLENCESADPLQYLLA